MTITTRARLEQAFLDETAGIKRRESLGNAIKHWISEPSMTPKRRECINAICAFIDDPNSDKVPLVCRLESEKKT